jgi:hypothetical protein
MGPARGRSRSRPARRHHSDPAGVPVHPGHRRPYPLDQAGPDRTGHPPGAGEQVGGGWYTGSPRPGQVGSAIIAGHIDSYRGPGVFFRLRLLRPGDRIYVRHADGTLAVFRVYAEHMFAKDRFPTRPGPPKANPPPTQAERRQTSSRMSTHAGFAGEAS